METTTYTAADGYYPNAEDWAALHQTESGMELTFDVLKNALAEIKAEVEAEFLAEDLHIIRSNTLANGMPKGFDVKAVAAVTGYYPDFLHVYISSAWGAKHIGEIKRRVGYKLQARFPEQRFCHRKNRGFKIWFTYFSDGNVDGWAAGIDCKGLKEAAGK